MNIKKDYTILFNVITNTIQELETIIFKANNSLELLKKAQITTEEMFLSETDNEDTKEVDN